MRIVSVCNSLHPGLSRLVGSVKSHGMRMDIVGVGRSFHSVSDKLVYMLKWLTSDRSEVADDDLVLFVDAYDAVVVADEDHIVARIRGAYTGIEQNGILISGELNCYPDATLAMNYALRPESAASPSGPYIYVNSGVYAGTKRSVVNLLKTYELPLGASVNDQALFTKTYLDGGVECDLKIDTKAAVFQSMWDTQPGEVVFDKHRGCVFNRRTNTYPCVVHGNGGSSLGPALEYLRGKQCHKLD